MTPEVGPRVGATIGPEGVEGYTQKKVAPGVYGPKAKVNKDGVTVDPGAVSVETPGAGPAEVHGVGERDGAGNVRLGGGAETGAPGVGDVAVEGTVPVDPSAPENLHAAAVGAGYEYDNTPYDQQDPKILYQADQLDGGDRLQRYNDSMYGSPQDTMPNQRPLKSQHVTHCPTCPPWPNVPKKKSE